MTRIILLAATTIGLIAPIASADAGSRHKHQSGRHHHNAWRGPAHYGPGPAYGRWQAPVGLQRRTAGPPWAMPNECYTDEGYGRFSSCDRRR